MARVVTPATAKSLGLPGRKSFEFVSAETGSKSVTLRFVEIPVPAPGDQPRGPHSHDGFEECIYVMSGQGTTYTENGEHPLWAGDAILIAPGERHVTRNTGTEPLVLLCFFPVADISTGTTDPGVAKA